MTLIKRLRAHLTKLFILMLTAAAVLSVTATAGQAADTASNFRARQVAIWTHYMLTTPPALFRPPALPGEVWTGAMEPDGCDAHHIIPQRDPNALFARQYLAYGGIDIQATANGVLLSRPYHHSITTVAYTYVQHLEFAQFETLPNGLTTAGARFYSTLYLQQANTNLWNAGVCGGVFTSPSQPDVTHVLTAAAR